MSISFSESSPSIAWWKHEHTDEPRSTRGWQAVAESDWLDNHLILQVLVSLRFPMPDLMVNLPQGFDAKADNRVEAVVAQYANLVPREAKYDAMLETCEHVSRTSRRTQLCVGRGVGVVTNFRKVRDGSLNVSSQCKQVCQRDFLLDLVCAPAAVKVTLGGVTRPLAREVVQILP